MPLLWLALHGLRSSRTFVLLVLAVALAAGFEISNAANLAGFEASLLDDALAHGMGDVRIWPRDRLRFDEAESAMVAKLGEPVAAVPLLTFPGAVATARDRRFVAAPIWGVDAAAQRPPFRVVSGAVLRADPSAVVVNAHTIDHVDVLLGTGLAAQIDARVGDPIELRAITGPRDELLGLSNTLAVSATVRGLVTGTPGGYRAVFVDRAQLGAAAGVRGMASVIALHLEDHAAARATTVQIEASHPELEARAWNDDDPSLTSFLGLRRAIGGISYAMVIAAIAIPMWALLYIHVLRKQRELAILAAIGFARHELFAVCTVQSVMIAALGSILGAGIGYGLTSYFDAHPLVEWAGLAVRPQLTAATFELPFAVIVATSIAAALHPALRAARVDPAVVLRRIE
jgi:lipoprotein-releasing system permease protein